MQLPAMKSRHKPGRRTPYWERGALNRMDLPSKYLLLFHKGINAATDSKNLSRVFHFLCTIRTFDGAVGFTCTILASRMRKSRPSVKLVPQK